MYLSIVPLPDICMARTCGTLEVTQRVSDCLLRLPLYHYIMEEDINYITGKIMEFYKKF